MDKFKTPKLLITDYYDEQIRQVDIYIEELLEKYNENDLLPEETKRSCNSDDISSDEKENSHIDSDSDSESENDANSKDNTNKIDEFKDPYRSKYNYDQNKMLQLNIIPVNTRVRDYLELVRSKAIDELKKVEQQNLDNYKLNKDLYKYDRETLTDQKVEEMRENLFKDNFAFVVVNTSKKSIFKSHTVLTDFYLDENDLTALK